MAQESSSRYRPVHRTLTPVEAAAVDQIKTKAAEIERLILYAARDGRCSSLAITNLEQSVMWAVKAITA